MDFCLLSFCTSLNRGEPCLGLAVVATAAEMVSEGEEGEGEGGGGESNEGDQRQVRQPGVDESSRSPGKSFMNSTINNFMTFSFFLK